MTSYENEIEESLFPAHAGMNRRPAVSDFAFAAVPRTRGDEPDHTSITRVYVSCSPHTRG